MADRNNRPLDAFGISQLGRAFDERLKEETAGLEAVLGEREAELSRIEHRLDVAFDGMLVKFEELVGEIVSVRAERDQIARDAEWKAQELGQVRDDRARLANEVEQLTRQRDGVAIALAQETERLNQEIERLKLYGRNEVEALCGQHREAEASLRAELVARMREAAETAEVRIATLALDSQTHEAKLMEHAAEVRLQDRLETAREASRADYLATRVTALSEVIRQGREIADARAEATLSLLLSESQTADLPEQSVADAVDWLATNVEALRAGTLSAAFEVAAAIRWIDETFVAAGYRWLLGRPVDEHGRAHYCQMLRRGMTRGELLIDLARSDEAVSRLRDGTAVREAEDRNFVMAAYGALLDRGADTGGLEHYLAKINDGMSRGQVLLNLARSGEAREAATAMGSALWVIWHVNRPSYQARQLLNKLILRHTAPGRHAWQAGRLAVLECEAALARRGFEAKLDDLGRLADQRVAAARAVVASNALLSGAVSADARASSASAEVAPPVSPAASLADSSCNRTPGQIVALIRNELKELGRS